MKACLRTTKKHRSLEDLQGESKVSDFLFLLTYYSGVPGELRGLEYLHKHYGLLEWSTVVNPAVRVAQFGFTVTGDLVRMMNNGDNNFLVDDRAWALDFAPNGTRVGLGDTMYRKRYADVLEDISEHGPDVFYTGWVANKTISAIRSANGTMCMDDLKAYSAETHDPLQIDYREYRLTSSGAPASGAVALSALKIVEGYKDFGVESTGNLSTHRLNEAFRFAYGQVQLSLFLLPKHEIANAVFSE